MADGPGVDRGTLLRARWLSSSEACDPSAHTDPLRRGHGSCDCEPRESVRKHRCFKQHRQHEHHGQYGKYGQHVRTDRYADADLDEPDLL